MCIIYDISPFIIVIQSFLFVIYSFLYVYIILYTLVTKTSILGAERDGSNKLHWFIINTRWKCTERDWEGERERMRERERGKFFFETSVPISRFHFFRHKRYLFCFLCLLILFLFARRKTSIRLSLLCIGTADT